MDAPSRLTIRGLRDKFEKHGSVHDIRKDRSWAKHTVITEEITADVLALFESSLWK
jgi:hypothetical protein